MRPASSLAWLAVLALAVVPASAQDRAQMLSHADAYWYGRFGYGTVAADQRFGGLSPGFGRRIERHALGLDVLFFSAHGSPHPTRQTRSYGAGDGEPTGAGGDNAGVTLGC